MNVYNSLYQRSLTVFCAPSLSAVSGMMKVHLMLLLALYICIYVYILQTSGCLPGFISIQDEKNEPLKVGRMRRQLLTLVHSMTFQEALICLRSVTVCTKMTRNILAVLVIKIKKNKKIELNSNTIEVHIVRL